MMFIDRDETMMPTGLYAVRQREGQEEIANNHPDVIGFISGGMVWDTGAWRSKTAQELGAEKDAEALLLQKIKPVAEAILEAVFDMKQNPGNYTTAGSLKQKALQQYRAKL